MKPRVLPGLADRLSGNILDKNMLFVRGYLSGNSRPERCRNSRVDSPPVHPLQYRLCQVSREATKACWMKIQQNKVRKYG